MNSQVESNLILGHFKFNWSAVQAFVKRSVDGQKFVVPELCTLVLRKDLKWPRLTNAPS